MEDLNDLLFDLTEDCCIDPLGAFGEMEILILEDNDDDSKEIEEISFYEIEPVPKLENLEDSIIMQDDESDKEAEKNI